MRKLLCLVALVLGSWTLVKSEVLLTETFDHNVSNLSDAAGWTTTGTLSAGGGRTLDSTPLTYSNSGGEYLLSGLGKSVSNTFIDGSNYISYKPFTAVTAGVVYLSFLYQVGDDQAQSASEIIGLSNSNTNSRVKAWAGKGAASSKNPFRLGVSRSTTTGADIQWAGSEMMAVGEVYLIVIKYDFAAESATLYVNPTVGSTLEPADFVAFDNSKSTGNTSLSYLMFKHNGKSVANFKVGGVRLTTTWAEAVAAASSSTLDITSTSPKPAELISAQVSQVELLFNKNIAPAEGVATLSDGVSSTTIALESITIQDKKATLPVSLIGGVSYTLTVPAGMFKDIDNPALQSALHTWSFNTIPTVPLSYKGSLTQPWKAISAPGWSAVCSSDDRGAEPNGVVATQFSSVGNHVKVQYDGQANWVSFRARSGSADKGYSLTAFESEDGKSWTPIVAFVGPNVLPYSSANYGLFSYPLQLTSRFFKIEHTAKPSGGTNMSVDDIAIWYEANPTTEQPVLVSSTPENGASSADPTNVTMVINCSKKVKVNVTLADGVATISRIKFNGAYLPFNSVSTDNDGGVVLRGLVFEPLTSYSVEIEKDALLDVYGNGCEASTINFTTSIDTSVDQISDLTSIWTDGSTIYTSVNGEITLYSMQGAKVVQGLVDGSFNTGLTSGLYLVKLRTIDGKELISKIEIR